MFSAAWRLPLRALFSLAPACLPNDPCSTDPEPPQPIPPTSQSHRGVPPPIDDPLPAPAEPVREPRAPTPPAVANRTATTV